MNRKVDDMLLVEITITGKTTCKEVSSLKDYLECIEESIEKLREQGSAECTVKVSGQTE